MKPSCERSAAGPASAARPMRRRQGHHHRLVEEVAGPEIVDLALVRAHEGDVDPAGPEGGDEARGRLLQQFDLHVRMGAAVVADRTRHQGVERGRGGEADADLADIAARDAQGPGLGGIDGGEHRAGIVREGAAGLGQRHPARQALEQGGADLGLEALDLVAQRRLRDVQPLRRPGDAEIVGHRDEVAKMAKLHRAGILPCPGRRRSHRIVIRQPTIAEVREDRMGREERGLIRAARCPAPTAGRPAHRETPRRSGRARASRGRGSGRPGSRGP